MMQRTKTWRSVLEIILASPQEKQRLANDLQISFFTLQRWACGEVNPRIDQLERLLLALPYYHSMLFPLVTEDFEGGTLKNLEIEDIPSIFYAQVLRGSTTIPIAIRFWSLASIILQQVLIQLDPYRNGLLLRVARFLPPDTDGKLHCLHEAIIQGTTPWKEDTTQNAILLGAESLAGQALTVAHPIVSNSRDDDNLLPTALRGNEVSILAFPIKRGNRVAGAFLISSPQEGYFTPLRLSLIHRYTDLLTLTFESEDFYEPDTLDLASMPEVSEQRRQLSTFRQRVAALLKWAEREQQPLNTIQAEVQIWQQFAEEFRLRAS